MQLMRSISSSSHCQSVMCSVVKARTVSVLPHSVSFIVVYLVFCRFFDLFEKCEGYKSGKLKLKKPKQLQVRRPTDCKNPKQE